MALDIDINYNRTTDIFIFKKLTNAAIRKLRKIRDNAKRLRDHFFDQSTQVAILTMKGSYEQVLRSIRRHKESRQDFVDISRVIKLKKNH